MAEAALESEYQRQLASARNRNSLDQNEQSGDVDNGSEADASEAGMARQFRQMVNLARNDSAVSGGDKAKKEAFDKLEKATKEAARRWALRVIGYACGVTFVLFLVTWLLWTFRFIFGNWLDKGAPKLSTGELIIWGFTSLLVFISCLILVFLIIILLIVSMGPVVALKYFGPSFLWLITKLTF